MLYLTPMLKGCIDKSWSTPTKDKIKKSKRWACSYFVIFVRTLPWKENPYGKYRYENMSGMTSRTFNNGIDQTKISNTAIILSWFNV